MGHSHHHQAMPAAGNTGDARYQAARNVTVWGAVVNVLLSIGKVVIGIASGSQSLVADGIHSLSDLLTDVMVIFAAKHASRDADDDHPYGHGRIETLITVALGVILLLVAGGIAVDATFRLFHPERLTHPGVAAALGGGRYGRSVPSLKSGRRDAGFRETDAGNSDRSCRRCNP